VNDVWAYIRGQEHVKRALEVAAAGGHHVLLVGPHGAGKTLLARAFPSILPPPTPEEQAEIAGVYAAIGQAAPGDGAGPARPFRAPTPAISPADLVGDGAEATPGEVSLAHRGVLFLDDLPRFGTRVLEALGRPLDEHQVTVGRLGNEVTFPASLILTAAMVPCPCGHYGDPLHECTCSAATVSRYRERIPPALWDRLDIYVELAQVEVDKLADGRPGEPAAPVRARVQEARERQQERFQELPILTNGEMGPAQVQAFCRVDEAGQALLRAAMRQLNLSARGYHRILKVGRTIADLAGSEGIHVAPLAEAIQYRPRPGLL